MNFHRLFFLVCDVFHLPTMVALMDILAEGPRRTAVDNWLEAHGFKPKMVGGRQAKGADDVKLRGIAVRSVSQEILNYIDRYGETGYGDKPEDMDTVLYWLAHLKFEFLQQRSFAERRQNDTIFRQVSSFCVFVLPPCCCLTTSSMRMRPEGSR
jgi:hypothetical protein